MSVSVSITAPGLKIFEHVPNKQVFVLL